MSILLGGINKPVVEEVIFTEALKVLGYPSSSILSVMILPIADAAASAEPESAMSSAAIVVVRVRMPSGSVRNQQRILY